MGSLGIIGGSGVYGLDDLSAAGEVEVETPFGRPSAPVRAGTLGATDVLFLPRHGIGHVYSPTNVPYRANIYALKQLGATHLVSLSAVGSLRDDLPPRTLVLPDQIIDRTLNRPRTFFDRGIVAHVGLADPMCAALRTSIQRAASEAGQPVVSGGTYICIEGPQFSTRAESRLYRTWDAAVIGMTAMPEARLAREAGLCYATLAMVTDYDVWHESEADVTVDVVLSHLRANSEAAGAILRSLVWLGLPERSCSCAAALDNAIMTDPAHVPAEEVENVALLIEDRLAR